MANRILFILSILFFVAWLVYTFRKNRRYLNGPTRNALGEELQAEFAAERTDFSRRTKKFSRTLEQAVKKRITA